MSAYERLVEHVNDLAAGCRPRHCDSFVPLLEDAMREAIASAQASG